MTPMTTTELLAGLAERQRTTTEKDRALYRAVVERLAADAPEKGDTPAAILDLLGRLGVDTEKLNRDVEAVRRLAALKVEAGRLVAAEAEHRAAGAVVEEVNARHRQAAEAARLELARVRTTARTASYACDVTRAAAGKVLAFADRVLLERYEEARSARDAIVGALWRVRQVQLGARFPGGREAGTLIVSPEEAAKIDTSLAAVQALEEQLRAADGELAEALAEALASARLPVAELFGDGEGEVEGVAPALAGGAS